MEIQKILETKMSEYEMCDYNLVKKMTGDFLEQKLQDDIKEAREYHVEYLIENSILFQPKNLLDFHQIFKKQCIFEIIKNGNFKLYNNVLE